MGWLHKEHFGESRIFMLCSLMLVMRVFLKTLYWRCLASSALEVLRSLMIRFSNCAGSMGCVSENLLSVGQMVLSNLGLLLAFDMCLQPLMLGLVSCSSGGRKGA